jgi:hypothetical protein
MEITYTQHGDFMLPDLLLPKEETPTFGKYGRLHLKLLKEHRRATYVTLLKSGQLTHHLNEADRDANVMLHLLISQMAQAQGITEQLKGENQMAWVGRMNNIRNAAEEIVQAEVLA